MRRVSVLIVIALVGGGLLSQAVAAAPDRNHPSPAFRSNDAGVRDLTQRFVKLSLKIKPIDAERIARSAFRAAHELSAQYAVFGPALFHNFLVNTGFKKRGLCYQWTQDLIERLDAEKVHSVVLHWGVAHRDSWREHNCVVVTAPGQAFRDGVLLDLWRNAGRLYYGPVATDRYPWHEDDWDWHAHIQIPKTR